MRMSALLDRWGTDCIGSERGERGGGRGQVGCAVVVGGVVGCADVAEGVVRAGGKCSSEHAGEGVSPHEYQAWTIMEGKARVRKRRESEAGRKVQGRACRSAFG